MNNLSSYFGLDVEKIRASDKDLPVQNTIMIAMLSQQKIKTEMRKIRRIRKRK
jgi:hypothetical protein